MSQENKSFKKWKTDGNPTLRQQMEDLTIKWNLNSTKLQIPK